jgi:hypothetical protein
MKARTWTLLAGGILSSASGIRSAVPLLAEPEPAGPARAAAPWFARPADNGGIDFVYASGHRDRFLMPEIMGGGVALFDMDGDHDLDLYFVQGGTLEPARRGHDRLFRNHGGGSFSAISTGVTAETAGYGQGIAAGDYDNDGDTDLYVTKVGPNTLLRNDGRGRFTDVTASAGVGHAGWGTSAVFFDYDRDGDLDLFAANYIDWSLSTERDCYNPLGERDYCAPNSYEAPARDVLYRNQGGGRFQDVTEAAGLDQGFGNGLGVVTGDFDRDGWLDLYVANDGLPNQLWINQRDGTFRDQALLLGCAVDGDGKAKAGMGVAAADLDDDGDPELLVGNLGGETDSLYRHDGAFFTDVTRAAGLGSASRTFTRFGLALLDFDNDGRLDLFQANGRVTRRAQPLAADPFAEPNLLFRGLEGLRFTAHPLPGGTSEPLIRCSRAAAFGDLDNDGGIDIVIVNRDAPADLLRNVVPARGHWLLLRLIDRHGRDSLNAVARVRAGSRTWIRETRAAFSYLASSDPRVHVGLGAVGRVDEIVVDWPDGAVERFGGVPGDRLIELRQGLGEPIRQPASAGNS